MAKIDSGSGSKTATEPPTEGDTTERAPSTIDSSAPGDTADSAPADPSAEPQDDRPKMADLIGVQFKPGRIDSKRFSAADLRQMGVEPKDEDDLVWDKSNGFQVPVQRLNADTVDALIKLPGFTAV